MLEKINQTADFLKSKVHDMPSIAIILGTGLGALVDHIYHTQQFQISQFLQLRDIAEI